MSKYSDKVKARLEAKQAEIKPTQPKKIDTLAHLRHSEFCNYCTNHHTFCFGGENEGKTTKP